ncbi:Lysophospholipase [Pestalotiopsis fici W106-1]|uniref:Lysophospholipase n=1 Tax=Pestalotiopsis fici (strain W106-1 / CGMCC3.15140) TaxID=1229662 RepID=W3X4B0_PESFW|nr:Lysophospholipase [Pestalotiopsis fici W106-1]ETS80978.1 Lysophospholipase [Pestalotiopsis fici W106-1]
MQLSLPSSLLSLIGLVLAVPDSHSALDLALANRRRQLVHRASPDSPSGGYAPANVDCPSARPTIRSAHNLSTSESDWLDKRRQNVLDPLSAFLSASNITDFDAESYISSNKDNLTAIPNVAIAVSGGGYRALMNGAGFIAAADSRVNGSSEASGIGGLLQASTYLAGLSGGGWLVGSIYANNFSTVVELRDGSPGSSVWAFDRSIFQGPEESGISILNTASYWDDIANQVDAKRDIGYDASITDYWGRALSYQLINATDGGPAYTFSSIADSQDFKDANQPMPILVADGRVPGVKVITLNATVYEMNPWEIGTFDPTVFAFAPIKYVGSNFTNGSVPDDGHCVEGFDQYGYVMGTSSSLFNQFILQNLTSSGIPDFLVSTIQDILDWLGEEDDDIADWAPNPFYGYDATGNNYNVDQESLTLVDGGEDLQNIPLHPLIQPERAVDVIFAVDSSADTTYNWPNGTALRASYDRSKGSIANGTEFPAVPDAETFINLGLNRKPTFFGCDVNNFTSPDNAPPLVVYIANTPYTAWSNVSTYDPSYADDERNNIIQNGYNVGTMGNGTLGDSGNWRTCIGCAIMSRTWAKAGADVPSVCQDCFTEYCWDGTVNSTAVGSFEPEPFLTLSAESAAVSFVKQGPAGLMSCIMGITLLLLAF